MGLDDRFGVAFFAAPKIRTYVVPRDNIWSGSAFRNIDPTAFFGVYIGLTAVFFVCEEGGRTYVWKVGAETGKPRATPWGSDPNENPPSPERAKQDS